LACALLKARLLDAEKSFDMRKSARTEMCGIFVNIFGRFKGTTNSFVLGQLFQIRAKLTCVTQIQSQKFKTVPGNTEEKTS